MTSVSSSGDTYKFVTSSLMNEKAAQETWQRLKSAIKDIQDGNSSHLRYEECYRHAFNLVSNKYGDLLYNGALECVRERMVSVKEKVVNADTSVLVDTLATAWENHKRTMKTIREVLLYLRRTYCQQKHVPDVHDVGLLLFRDEVVQHPDVSSRLRNLLQQQVQADREGKEINKDQLKSCLSMLVDVQLNGTDVYQRLFENEFLIGTMSFYARESEAKIQELSIPDYLRYVEMRLMQEEQRASTYLDPSTKYKLRAVVQQQLIVTHARRIVDDPKSGCETMFQQCQINNIFRLYRIFLREPIQLEQVSIKYLNCIKQAGIQLVNNPANAAEPTKFIQDAVDLRDRYNKIAQEGFRNDRNFVRRLREGVEAFINLDTNAARYMSLYIDHVFRNSRTISQSDMTQRLESMIYLFKYLLDKDVFEDFYKQHLAGRLLSASADMELERSMITRLKEECGHQFTSRLEGMFKDVETSHVLLRDYKNSEFSKGPRSMDFSVLVLTSAFWPISSSDECKLPAIASAEKEKFTQFYAKEHSGRVLRWQTNQGSAIMYCQFEAGAKELLVHTLQMCILMLYNEKNTYTYKELEELTKIPTTDLQRHLLSLAHPKVKVLKKSPPGMEIGPDHTFEYNMGYKATTFRVKIPMIAYKMVENVEKQEVTEAVMAQRRVCIDAAIVRIMKAKKRLEHTELVSLVTKQLQARFMPDPAFLKTRIEHLIDTDFIARDSSDRKYYVYT